MSQETEFEMKISLRVRGISPDKDLAEHVQKRALLALGRFSTRIANVVVRLEDMNGPKGGIDKRCSIELTGSLGQKLVEVRDQNFNAAIDRGFAVAQRSLARLVQRRGREYGFLQ
jgi:putative sigma-54 modulation protein